MNESILFMNKLKHRIRQTEERIIPKKEKAQYTKWDEFDPLEYAKRNYEVLFPEDKIIIMAVNQAIREYEIEEDQFENAADIGTGSNLYPAMLLSPYVKSKISLIEFSASNRDYLEKILGDNPQGEYLEHKYIWEKYGKSIETMFGNNYKNIFDKTKGKVEIIAGSIYNLPIKKYSVLSSFFCAESITDKPEEFKLALESLVNCLKPGGLFIIAHIVNSLGYFAGKVTKFPAVNFSYDDLRNVYHSLHTISEFSIARAVALEGEKKFRQGYHGMAVIIGTKK